MNNQARIVIVGGGIMGVSLLYHLAEEGCEDILLIEKGELTSGSTWHAAGQCPSMVGNYNLAKIHNYGNWLYSRLEEITGQYVSWHPSGGIRLALTQDDLDWFHYMKGIANNVGFRMEIIDPEKIKEINPFINTEGVIAGAWTLDDGHADPAGLTNAMAIGAKNMGASIERHNRVLDIKQMSSGEWQVITEKGNIIAETVVNAAGCYARRIAQMVGRDYPIVNVQHHYIVTDVIEEFTQRDEEIQVIRDPRASSYLRQEQQSGLIGIYERKGITEAWTPEGLPPWESDSELFSEDLDRLMPWLQHAMERIPIFEDAGIKRVVCGAIAHTPDGGPLLGPVAGLKNFWNCCGASFGIAQGAGIGKYLTQWMLYGDSEINMTGFDSRRYGSYADKNYMNETGFQDYKMTYITPMPGEELSAGRSRRLSPLHNKLKSKGCVYTETFGWERPKWFSLDGREEDYSRRHNNVFDVIRDECLAVRERVGILDLTGFAKYEVTGPDAESYLNRIFANTMPTKEGGIVLAHILSNAGRINAEMTITRMGDNHFYLLSAAIAEIRDFDYLTQAMTEKENIEIVNVTDARGVLVLAGPKAREVMEKVTEEKLDNASFPWLTGKEINISGLPTRALRINYVGELGWEIHPPIEHLEAIYDALWQAGEELGIADFGLYAVDSLRMEKAYRHWGGELTNEVTMIDSDMERFIKLDKDNFIGKEATIRQQQEERLFQLVYFEIEANDSDINGGEPIYIADKCIGITTSGDYGHFVKKSLGFGYVKPDNSLPGTELYIDLLGDRCRATVLKDPIYDPHNERLKG